MRFLRLQKGKMTEYFGWIDNYQLALPKLTTRILKIRPLTCVVCAQSRRSFFNPKIKKGCQAQWQNRKPLNSSEPTRNKPRRSLHRNSTSWNVWRTERSIWNRAYKPQFRQKRKRSRSPAGPRRLGTATRISASLSQRLSAFFESTPDQDPKAAKYAVLIPGPGMFVNVRNAPRVVIPPTSETPLFRRVSPCVRSFSESRVCTRFHA